MTAALLLLGYAAVAAVAGRWVLLRARWPRRSPGWGVLAWQALTVSVAAAVVLAGVAVALPLRPGPVAELLSASPASVVHHYRTPVGTWPGVLTLGLALAVVVRLTGLTLTALWRSTATRRALRGQVALLGARHPDGYTVLEHPEPLVYCLPGGRGELVATRGALEVLSPDQLRLVLGHERRHLRARHDLALHVAGALARTLPLRVLRDGHRELATLVEMAADDTARERSERHQLARALVALGTGGRTPAGPAPARRPGPGSGTDAVARVVRLATSHAPLGRTRRALVAAGAAVLLATPVGLALAPAIEAAGHGCCDDAGPGPQSRVDQ